MGDGWRRSTTGGRAGQGRAGQTRQGKSEEGSGRTQSRGRERERDEKRVGTTLLLRLDWPASD